MSSVVGSLVVTVGADVSKLESGFASAEKRMKSFGGGMTQVGTVLSTTVTAPLLAIGAAAVSASTALNERMANVASLGVAADRVLELKSAVQETAIATGKSTSDIAEGLYQVISAFGDSADTAQILEINAKSAAAGLATTTDAINLTSSVTKAYGDTSAEAVQRVSDLALTTVQLGQTTFPELAGSIGSVTPLANNLNVSMEEMFGVMATATGVTGNTSEVATQLRGSLQALMAPTDSMQQLMEKLGYNSGAAMIKGEGLQGTIAAIVNEANASGKPLQDYIGSIEGQTLAMYLAGEGADKLASNITAMGDAAGATDKAFAAQTTGINKLGFGWEQLKVKLEVTAQKIGDRLAPSFSKLMDNVTPLIDHVVSLVDWFSQLDPQVQQNAIMIAGLAIAIGPVLVAGGMLISALASIGGALAFLISPIGLVIAAVGLLAAAWYFNWGGIRDYTDLAITRLTELWNGLVTWFTVTLPAAVVAFKSDWDEKWLAVQTTYTNVETALTTGWTTLKTWLTVTLVDAFTTFRDDAKAKWESIKSYITTPLGVVTGTLNDLSTWLNTTLPEAFTTFKDFLARFTISNPFGGLGGWLDSIKSNIQWIIDHLPLIGGSDSGGGKSGSRSGRSVGTTVSTEPVSRFGDVYVTVNVEQVASEIDVHKLAYQVADVVRRSR